MVLALSWEHFPAPYLAVKVLEWPVVLRELLEEHVGIPSFAWRVFLAVTCLSQQESPGSSWPLLSISFPTDTCTIPSQV